MTDKSATPVTALNLYQKLAAITGEVGQVAKGGTNKEQGYAFIEYAAVAGALRALFAKYNVMVMPDMGERETEEVQTRTGKPGAYVKIKFTFTFINGDKPDERHTINWVGEAIDYGDKAINKAATAALKYCLMRTFNVSEKGEEEADSSSHQLAPPPAKPKKMTVQDAIAAISAALNRKGVKEAADRKAILLKIAGVQTAAELSATHLNHVMATVENALASDLQAYLDVDVTEEAGTDLVVQPASVEQLKVIKRLMVNLWPDLDADGFYEHLTNDFGIEDPELMTEDEANKVVKQLEGGK